MSKPLSSGAKFWLLTSTILLATAGGLAVLCPLAIQAAHNQSDRLAEEASRANGGEAEADYQLATWLNPKNQAAYTGLARAQIANGHPEEALISLERAGEGSEVEQLKVRTLLELGRYNEAANEAVKLTEPNRTSSDLMLAVLAAAAAERPQDPAVTSRLSSPEAVQRVQRATAGKIPLAAELYLTGLLRSSSALLAKQPASYERNLLLARISYHRHSKTELNKAVSLLNQAIELNPAGIEARQLLVATYRDQANAIEAAKQDTFITKLRSGQP